MRYFNIPQEHRSVYYANRFCDALEKPKELIYQGIDTDHEILDLIATIAQAILLIIPAVIGTAISRCIYVISGEKIKDYQIQLNGWQNKIYNPQDERRLQTVIDGMIRHRINPSNCPFDTIQELKLNNKSTDGVHTIFGFEGPLHKVDQLSPIRNKFLILMAPARHKDLKDFTSRLQIKDYFPTDETTRAYYKKSASEAVDRNYADKCSFVWLPPSSVTGVQIRRLDNSTINALKKLMWKN